MDKFFKYHRIRDLREDNNFTQEDIAKYLNMKQGAYSNYECGRRTMSIEVFEKLAKYYNTSIDYLAGETDERKPYPRAK